MRRGATCGGRPGAELSDVCDLEGRTSSARRRAGVTLLGVCDWWRAAARAGAARVERLRARLGGGARGPVGVRACGAAWMRGRAARARAWERPVVGWDQAGIARAAE